MARKSLRQAVDGGTRLEVLAALRAALVDKFEAEDSRAAAPIAGRIMELTDVIEGYAPSAPVPGTTEDFVDGLRLVVSNDG